MPEWPPECITDNTNIQRRVALYLEGNQTLWIQKDDLEWLLRTLYIQQQVKGVSAVCSDDEGPDAHDSVEDDMTPEKRPKPQQLEGHLHDKWSEAP